MTAEYGIYTPDGFVPREEIMRKLSRDVSPTVDLPMPKEGLSFTQHFDRVERLQESYKETGIWNDTLEVKVKTNGLPFYALRPLSDMHMGAVGVDMKSIRKHLEDIREHHIGTAMLGDIGDFFSPTAHPEGMMGDVITPDDQLDMVYQFFNEFKDRIICTVQDPSHTDWIRTRAGIEPQRRINQMGVNTLKNGGILTLKVNSQEYKIAMFHQIGRYNSSLNITNAHKRMMDMHQDVDVVIAGHTHIGDMEKLVKRDKKVVAIQLGTFKVDDDFGVRKGLVPRPQVFFPTLMFSGKKHNIEIIEDREDASEYVKTFRHLLSLR